MKISQLIKKLETFKKKQGDLRVWLVDPGTLFSKGEVLGTPLVLCPWFEDQTLSGKPVGLVLMDEEAAKYVAGG